MALDEEPYSIRIVVFAGGVGGGVPAWAFQLASTNKVIGDVPRLAKSKSEKPVISIESPAAIFSENSNESKLSPF